MRTKLKEQNNYKYKITIDRIACPLHILQLNQGMKQIKQGEILKIISSAYVAPELLAAARQMSRNISINENHEIFIQK